MRCILSNDLAARGCAETLEGLLFVPRAVPPSGDPELAELVSLANDLRDLPRSDFKATLRVDLSLTYPQGDGAQDRPRSTSEFESPGARC